MCDKRKRGKWNDTTIQKRIQQHYSNRTKRLQFKILNNN